MTDHTETDQSTAHVIAGTCARCTMPIVAIDPAPDRPAGWRAPPTPGRPEGRCDDGGAHVLRAEGGLVVAGRIAREAARDEAMALSELAVAVTEAIAAHERDMQDRQARRAWRGRPRRGGR